jgi:hypothetical protein
MVASPPAAVDGVGMHISIPHRLVVAGAAAALCLGVAACGDDDDNTAEPAATTTANQAPPTTAAPDTTAPPVTTAAAPETTMAPPTTGASDPAAFCDAEIALESAVATEDPDAIGPAFETLSASAPADVKDSVDTAIAEAQKFMASGDDPSPEFNAAYAEVIGFVKANCGFTDLSVKASNYQFNGLPREVAAGPAVITFENTANEFHEMVLFRFNDDVTENLGELLALPEKEAMRKVTSAGAVFVAPGETGYTALDLAPGRYGAVCFMPKGATPEAMAEMESSGKEPTGKPHFMLGMAQEFEVA